VVTGAEGKEVGEVRSAVMSPRFGPIALAMIRREVEPGATLIARSPGEGENAPPVDRRVDVAALPFQL
jgi:glycine cleavage system aminomethyltransferase T